MAMDVLDANPGRAQLTSLYDGAKQLLRLCDLSVNFLAHVNHESNVVRGVSFSMAAGEIVGVLGESGSGKTTMALSLMRLLPAGARRVSGSIEFDGHSLLDLNAWQLRQIRGAKISIIHQDSSVLNPVMRVGDQIMEILRAHISGTRTELRDGVYSMLSAMRLQDCDRIFRAYPHQLSGGQRRRIAIAQALVCKPQLVIADEPTAWLDADVAAEILSFFLQVREQYGTSFLLISHDPDALTIADRILVMYAGQIVEQGHAEEVLSQPRHPYTTALLRCAGSGGLEKPDTRQRRLPCISGHAPDPSKPASGCAFSTRCSDRMEICDSCRPALVANSAVRSIRCFKYSDEVESA
jgi:oligopeptide/dipeptide ABC transporter ATP-binding protein